MFGNMWMIEWAAGSAARPELWDDTRRRHNKIYYGIRWRFVEAMTNANCRIVLRQTVSQPIAIDLLLLRFSWKQTCTTPVGISMERSVFLSAMHSTRSRQNVRHAVTNYIKSNQCIYIRNFWHCKTLSQCRNIFWSPLFFFLKTKPKSISERRMRQVYIFMRRPN